MSNRTLFQHAKNFFSVTLMLSAFIMLGSCKQKKIGYVVMDIATGADKPMTTNANINSTIIVNGGDYHYIIKVAGKDKATAELTITKISYTADTIKKEYTLKKYPATKQTISLNKPANVDGNSDINVTATSVVYLDNGISIECTECCEVKGCTAICCGSEFWGGPSLPTRNIDGFA